MSKYLAELEYKGQVYTIVDIAAQQKLRTKADLVNGKVPSNQLPYIAYTTEELNALLKTKADVNSLAVVATTGQYQDLLNLPTNLGQFNNDKNYITVSEIPVTSVNGKTGDVIIDTVGGASYTEGEGINISTDNVISVDLDTIAQKSDIPEIKYPVTSVNGKTGDVVIEGTGGGDYTAGDGILISENTIAIDFDVVAKKSDISANATVNAPVSISSQNVVNNTISLDITNHPYACVGAVTLVTADGEEFLPLYQDTGVASIIKKTTNDASQVLLILTLGSSFVGDWSGFVYLQQFVHGQINTPTPEPGDLSNVRVENNILIFPYETQAEIVAVDDIDKLQLSPNQDVTYEILDESL